jgi:hypothetical protein
MNADAALFEGQLTTNPRLKAAVTAWLEARKGEVLASVVAAPDVSALVGVQAQARLLDSMVAHVAKL